MPTIAEAMALGKQCQKAGDLGRAEQVYRQILAAAPDQADVWFALGITYQLQKKLAEASAAYENALRLRPDCAEIYYNLGHALKEQGRSEAALASFAQAVRWNPNFADAHFNLGIALVNAGRRDEATAHYQQAVQLRPSFTEAWSRLGVSLAMQDQLDQAEACFRRAIALQPDNADAANDLGNVLAKRGRLEEAVASYRESLRLRPESAETHQNLGNMLTKLSKPDQALACYQEALRLMPEHADIHNNLGLLFSEQGRVDLAIASFQQAMRLRPNHPEFLSNLGKSLMEQGRLDEALSHFRQALALQADCFTAVCNYLFCLNYDPRIDSDHLFAEHRRVAGGLVHTPALPQNYDTPRDPERRLRIGYVSPDFRKHAVAQFLEGIFRHHDPRQVETIGYAEVLVPDAVTERFKTLLHGWRSTCGLSERQLAELVRADRIDILVDLAGFTAGNRLPAFTYKPAPIQVTYVGYPNTTGLTAIDYRLTDAVADPPGEPIRHTEELVRLAGGFCCHTPPSDAPDEVTPLPAFRTGHVTFGSPHLLAKLNDEVIDQWCAILQAVPGSRLLAFRRLMFGETKERLERKFLERGIPAERVELRLGPESKREYLAVYGEIDLFLDAFPYTGHTTTCESLWMGVPVLTLRGSRFASRASASVLVHAGLPELVANSLDEYHTLAVQLAGDWERLAQLRAQMRSKLRNSLLHDASTFTRRLEEAYRWMWRNWCTGG